MFFQSFDIFSVSGIAVFQLLHVYKVMDKADQNLIFLFTTHKVHQECESFLKENRLKTPHAGDK